MTAWSSPISPSLFFRLFLFLLHFQQGRKDKTHPGAINPWSETTPSLKGVAAAIATGMTVTVGTGTAALDHGAAVTTAAQIATDLGGGGGGGSKDLARFPPNLGLSMAGFDLEP